MYNPLLVKGVENFERKIEDYARLLLSYGVKFKNVGGAICWFGVNGSVVNCSFVDCSAYRYAGAIYCSNVNGSVVNCSFVDCNATDKGGGAVYWIKGSGSVGNCSFEAGVVGFWLWVLGFRFSVTCNP